MILWLQRNKKLCMLLGCILSIILVVTVLIIQSKLNNDKYLAEQEYVTECFLIDGDNKYEVRGFPDGYLYFFVNGKSTNKIGYYTTLNGCMKLSDEAGVSAQNVLNLPQLMDFTYSADIIASTQAIKYLKEDGYEIIRQFNGPSYIEMYLQKDDQRQRVIVTNTFIMCGDLTEESELPNLETYFNKYNIKYSW